jgi:hypothetical protein
MPKATSKPSRRSLGEIVPAGSALVDRGGRAALCDILPSPRDRMLELQSVGDYNVMFGDPKNIERIMTMLHTNPSEYCVIPPLYFVVEEFLQPAKKTPNEITSEFFLPKAYKHLPVQHLLKNVRQGKVRHESELNTRNHFLVGGLRGNDTPPMTFSAFHYGTQTFLPVDSQDNDDAAARLFSAIVKAREENKVVVIPFESMAITSGHMCTIIIDPKTRGRLSVNVFDPNGAIPIREAVFPFCKSYRAAVASCLEVLFRMQDVFDKVFVDMPEIPNMNLPGGRPRSNATTKAVTKLYYGSQLDKASSLRYQNESEGVCVVASLFVMCMALCYGRRTLRRQWWDEVNGHLLGAEWVPDEFRIVEGVDVTTRVRNGAETLHQAYNRIVFMRTFAWSICKMALWPADLNLIGINAPACLYDKKTGNVECTPRR